jgi:hypothetical protein
MMVHDLSIRSEDLELMDDFSIGGQILVDTLNQLRWINRLLGAGWPTVEGVARLWHWAGRPAQLSLLDIGAGSGDGSRLLLNWAEWRRVDMQITLIDIHPETCAAAAIYHHNEPRVQVQQGDVFALPPASADIVIASLFIHHFPAAQLPAVFRAMRRASRIGVVVNDLHRHWLAWASIWGLTRLFQCSPMIQYDAPLSVRRGFRGTDFAQLQALPDLVWLRYAWRPLFRYLVLLPRTPRDAVDAA